MKLRTASDCHPAPPPKPPQPLFWENKGRLFPQASIGDLGQLAEKGVHDTIWMNIITFIKGFSGKSSIFYLSDHFLRLKCDLGKPSSTQSDVFLAIL